jgi:DNA-directed RNA polymerase specialized sigma24 family protein
MRWTETEEELISKLWLEGFTAREIAARVPGRTESAVKSRLHHLGLKKNRKWSPEDKKLLLALKEDGASNRDLARQFDCSVGTVASMLSLLRRQTEPGKNSA